MYDIPFWQLGQDGLRLLLPHGNCGGVASTIEEANELIDKAIEDKEIFNGDQERLRSSLKRFIKNGSFPPN